MTDQQIAHIAHEALRAYTFEIADIDVPETVLPMWELAPEWMRLSSEAGVRYLRENPDADAQSCHAEWLRARKEQGWIHGTVKDERLKQHPSMVPWDELSTEERMKDVLFLAVVRAMDRKPSRIHLGGYRG